MTEVQGVVVMQNPVGFSFSQGCTELSLTSGEGAGEHYPPQGSRQVVQALGSHIDTATASAGAAGDGEKTQRQAGSTGKLRSRQTWRRLGVRRGLPPWPGWEGQPSRVVLGGGRRISSQRSLGGTVHLGVAAAVGTWKGRGWSQG